MSALKVAADARDAQAETNARFGIHAVYRSAVPDLAEFIYRWRIRESPTTMLSETAESIQHRLEWLLLGNPVRTHGAPLGYCIRDRHGAIRGINLCFPSLFLAGNDRQVGLCSGSFFVDPAVRSMGFYLFRKVLATRGPAFFFATTCNANSVPLWRMLGGREVPHSEIECVLPLRLDAIIPAFLGKQKWSGTVARAAGRVGACANPLLRLLMRRSSRLSVERCSDYEKLAALFRRHRDTGRVAVERSAESIEWRYGASSPAYPCDLYIVRDSQGNEGWIALARSAHGKLRGRLLLDAVWPRDKMSLREIFSAALPLCSGADAFFFRRQPGLEAGEYFRFALKRRLDAKTFVIAPKGGTPPNLDVFEYDDNDNIAWLSQTHESVR